MTKSNNAPAVSFTIPYGSNQLSTGVTSFHSSPFHTYDTSKFGNNAQNIIMKRSFSYAVVDHSDAYKDSMSGRHGAQLALATNYGKGADDPIFDPFETYAVENSDEVEEGDDLDPEENLEEESDVSSTVSNEEEKEEDDEWDVEESETFATSEVLNALEEGIAPEYNNDGSPIIPKSKILEYRAGAPAGGAFAVINLNSSQQKVTIDDVVIVNKLKPASHWSVGSVHTLTGDDVLLVGTPDVTLVGMPGIGGAEVDVMVEEITRDATVIVFKKRRRKNSRRKNGHRREVTFLRILDIRLPEQQRKIGI